MPSLKTHVDRSKYTLEFMKGVLKQNKSTGALGPSSRELANVVTDLAELGGKRVIVEFGPGTGVFTEAILERKDPDALFLAMEVNEDFVEATRRRCPGVEVVHDGAQNTLQHLEARGHSACDVIVSGLPWTRFPDELQDEILDATYYVLAPGGHFVTFAYATSPYVPSGKKFFKGKMEEKFDRVWQTKRIWKNFPPCVVFVGEKADMSS